MPAARYLADVTVSQDGLDRSATCLYVQLDVPMALVTAIPALAHVIMAGLESFVIRFVTRYIQMYIGRGKLCDCCISCVCRLFARIHA